MLKTPADEKDTRTSAALQYFTRGYITALLWSSSDTDPVTGEDVHLDEYELSKEAAERCAAECKAFFDANLPNLLRYVEHKEFDPSQGTVWDYAGHDFALTRNRHGAGFWDRSEVPEDVRDALTNACGEAGPFEVYLGDDKLVHTL